MSGSVACAIDVAYADPRPAGLPVSIGVPFREGELNEAAPLTVRAPSGELRPAAGRTLARWPDSSARWRLVSFGARETGAHEVLPNADPPAPQQGVSLTQDGDDWVIETDCLALAIGATGPGVFREIRCDGHTYLDDPAKLRFCVDEASTLFESERTVRVVEQSAVRARLRVEGAHYTGSGERRLTYRLDVEVWAGWPAIRLDYRYFHVEPSRPEERIERIALETDWLLDGTPERHFQQKNYGLFYVTRQVFNPAPVAVASDFVQKPAHVEDPAMLLDDIEYPFYLHPPLVVTAEWLGVCGAERAVYMQMRDFIAAKPNRLVSEGSRLDLEVWPANAETLKLPQGRSLGHTVTLAFMQRDIEAQRTEKVSNAPRQAARGVAAVLGAPVHEERACVAPNWLAHCGEFDQAQVLPLGQHIRIEGDLAAMMRLDMPDTKFDVGDTHSHYSSSYAGLDAARTPLLAGAPDIPRIWPAGKPTQTYLDCHEPVWTNNEYDAIHAFCNELMRTGRHELWRTIRLAARHNIEVDFLHYSDHKWLHRATPAHSARHTTTGAYPSHFWTQGLLEYYCMSGDEDALEVALALGDKTIENLTDPELRQGWSFDRELGWSILLLAHLYDITREERFKPLLDEIIDYIIGFDRDGFSGAVNLSAGNDRQSLNRQIVANFFGYASMLEGIDKYAAVTGRADVDEWLQKYCRDLADAAMQAAREGSMPGVNFSVTLSVGYERTGDKRFLDMIGLLLDRVYWNAPGIRGSGGRIKPLAGTYRGFTRFLGHAMRQGLLDAYEYPSALALRGTGGLGDQRTGGPATE